MIVKGGVKFYVGFSIFQSSSVYFIKEIPTRSANYRDNYTMAPLKIVFMHGSEVTIADRLPKMMPMVASS